MILYEIQIPLFGKRRWLTEIKHIEAGSFFVDEQRFGPYAFWHHKHFFNAHAGGLEIVDEVTYKPPLFLLGRLINRPLLQSRLAKIFEYRGRKLKEILEKQ